MREELKEQILSSIIPVDCDGQWYVVPSPVTEDAIRLAIREHNCVEIPDLGEPLFLEQPIILPSDHHLKVAKNQLITQAPGKNICLVRNENVRDGGEHPPVGERDRNISVCGGIWKTVGRGNLACGHPAATGYGNIIMCSVEQVEVHDVVIYDSSNYGVQICDCKDFKVENIYFDNHHKDGVHVNGPAAYGVVRHLSGKHMDDDMVALNAWDWYSSAITFGTIENLVVEDIQSSNNEVRLLPGQKIYEDRRLDCDIRNCVLEHISGIYTFKLYAQPNIANAVRKIHDVSGSVGKIENVFFHDISFVEVTPSGLNGLPVKSLFEICADCTDLYMEKIHVSNSVEQCGAMDLRLINVGPLSATWKNNSDDPDDWGEVFDPDAICRAEGIYLKDIEFNGKRVTDSTVLTREVKMELNQDYPRTTPKGGTGYGKIGKVCVE